MAKYIFFINLFLNNSFILFKALLVLAKMTIPEVGLSSLWITPKKTDTLVFERVKGGDRHGRGERN